MGDLRGDVPRLDAVLSKMMGRSGSLRRARSISKVAAAWVLAAGEELSDHTRVRSFKNGVLSIDVDSPPLCHRLASFQRDELLVRIQNHPNGRAVTKILFRMGGTHAS